MSKLQFNGDNAWFVSPDSKYGISRVPVKTITEGDFSFLAKIKVNWDMMNPNDNTREGGVIMKNGLHMGLSVIKPDNEHVYIKGTIWSVDASLGESGITNTDILLKLNWEDGDLEKDYEVGFSMKQKEKKFSIYCNGTWETKSYEGTLLDYSNAWLWIGTSNPLESCPIDFRQFFNGTIYNIGIFNKSLDKEEIVEIYEDFSNISKRLKPVATFDCQRQTPYKVLDISGNGNNLVKFDISWMDNI